MKKGLSFILAVSLTASALVSMNANAIAYYGISDTSDEYSELMANSTEVTEYYDMYSERMSFYVYKGCCVSLLDEGTIFDFTVPQEADIDSIEAVLNALDSSYEVKCFKAGSADEPKIRYSIVDKDSKNETKKAAMELCNNLKSVCDLQTFDYYGHIFTPAISYFYSSEILCYPYRDDFHPETPVVLREYVEKNLPEFEVVDEENRNEKWCTVKAKNPVTIEERFAAATKIREDIGLSFVSIAPGEAEMYSSEVIDFCNNVNGDANCDGEYTIADSTAILQALGNPDKYGLSLQGEFNADICNVGDGVTPSDALEVQKAMASKG